MTFLMIFQLFKIWDDIPAMQGVSATIRAAGPGLFSFGIIFISLLTVFAGSAMLAFGHQMEEFHNFYLAVKTTLIVMTTAATEVYDKQNGCSVSFKSRFEKDVQTQKQRSACLQFVFLMVFIIGFLAMAWAHEDIETVYELEHALDTELSKPFGQHSHTFRDVRDVVEIWEWLEKGLMPTLVHHKDAVSLFIPF